MLMYSFVRGICNITVWTYGNKHKTKYLTQVIVLLHTPPDTNSTPRFPGRDI